ncbi:MAG: carboxylesterase/lipase family protein [Rhodococcus sp.]|nr:carboxylesterase/lipase family protein [Rhodococcus sp. (in: high G+C Gram-positive bacteria)]
MGKNASRQLQETVVETADGTLRGRKVGDLLTWRGIPYAAAPVGPLRFRAPAPVIPWEGERDAGEFGDAPFQHRKFTRVGLRKFHPSSEDSLTLNVLARPGGGSRPVMVFIYGGAYTLGMSATPLYSGTSLVEREDVVYVSINYRLGALGYLDFTQFSTADRQFDSNLGLRDQVAALEWVQRNIAAFGGDPANVTLFGESAGAAAVVTLMSTPSARGLFARAIAQSPPVGLVSTMEQSTRWAKDFIDKLDPDTVDPAASLAAATPSQLAKAGNRLGGKVIRETPGLFPYSPVVDGDFLPQSPLEAFADGNAHRIPLIIGSNRNEGTLFPKTLDALPTTRARIEKMFSLTDPEAGRRVTAAYEGYPQPSAAIQLGGDLLFWWPTTELTAAHSRYAPTYSYRFDFAPRLLRWMKFGATHAFDLFAVFGQADTALGRLVTIAGGRRGLRAVSDSVARQWLSFATTGSPLPSWPKYTDTDRATVIFDEVTSVDYDPQKQRRLAWSGYGGYQDQCL